MPERPIRAVTGESHYGIDPEYTKRLRKHMGAIRKKRGSKQINTLIVCDHAGTSAMRAIGLNGMVSILRPHTGELPVHFAADTLNFDAHSPEQLKDIHLIVPFTPSKAEKARKSLAIKSPDSPAEVLPLPHFDVGDKRGVHEVYKRVLEDVLKRAAEK